MMPRSGAGQAAAERWSPGFIGDIAGIVRFRDICALTLLYPPRQAHYVKR
jgi:hypothetical protein